MLLHGDRSGLRNPSDPRFEQLLRLCKFIYPRLKKAFPKLPIFLEFMLENEEEMVKRKGVLPKLLPYTDMFAISTYPFLSAGGDPAEIPQDWFKRIRKLSGGKPWGIMETNHLAENFYHPTQGIRVSGRKDKLLIPSNEELQASYVHRLMQEAQSNRAEFILWWTLRDLDRLQTQLDNAAGAPLEPFSKLANDCGIIDERGRRRLSAKAWTAWLKLPKR